MFGLKFDTPKRQPITAAYRQFCEKQNRTPSCKSLAVIARNPAT